MSTAQTYDDVNRDLWNQWTPIHASSDFYDVAGFRSGKSTLKFIEQEALGDVSGKSILHLQCHFGLDSLSLARMGAQVTGVDYSDQSIAFARTLAIETGLEARFIQSNVYDLDDVFDEPFDIVFASYGVLHWLPDLGRLSAIVSRLLKDDAFFFLVEFHPFFNMLDEQGRGFVFPYFPGPAPVQQVKKGACVDPGARFEHDAYEWPHSLSELLMAVIDADLRIVQFREYPFMVFNCLPYLEDIGGGRYAAKHIRHPLPLMFSLKAMK